MIRSRYILAFLIFVTVGNICHSQETRARLDPQVSGTDSSKVFEAISLPRGGLLKIRSQKGFESVSSLVTSTIKGTHKLLESAFGPIEGVDVQVKLIRDDIFFATTGAPAWTNALFYKDTIIIPIKEEMNKEELVRSIKHEFTHEVVHVLSSGKAPGWIDEGLAQMQEGSTNPLIKKALFDWSNTHPLVPFYMLQNGFTKLENKYVVPAYAQSLWATTYLASTYGTFNIRHYFDLLSKNTPQPFYNAFGLTESNFESNTQCVIKSKICRETPSLRCSDCS